jgi:xyloglucan 6-xylosyltransferase
MLQQLLSSPQGRRIQRALNNMKITVMCGLMTILVLRGTIGAGYFGTPVQDYEEIRAHLQSSTRGAAHAKRALAEVEEKSGFKSSSGRTMPVAEIQQEEVYNVTKNNVWNAGLQGFPAAAVTEDWDAQRSQWKLHNDPNVSTSTVVPRSGLQLQPRMLLVTGSQPQHCANPVGDHYLLKSFKNKLDYCRLHSMEMFYNTADLDHLMTGFWTKLPLLRNLMLGHPEVEWLWWMDSDAMFTDMSFQIPLEKYQSYNLVLHGFNDSVYKNKSWTGLNTGSFLIRNCQWSLDLLDAWSPMGPKGSIRDKAGELLSQSLVGRPSFEADDQSALVYLLITQTAKWANKVFLESTFFLHGYWVELVEKYEAMMEKYHPGLGDERWPLVTHFVGCKPCSLNSGDYPMEKCVKQMERAFNFGDNQILDIYGYQHKSLEQPDVMKRILRSTDTSDSDPLKLS